MAQSPTLVRNVPTPLPLRRRDVTRILVYTVGAALLVGSLLSPWWTRGFDLTTELKESQGAPGIEGFYLSYGPFTTPGSLSGFTTDASRAAAAAVLGMGLLLTCAFLAAHHAVRLGVARGRIEASPDVAVRFAIAAFIAGLFSVLWALFFLPLLGSNPGLMWGGEYGADRLSNLEDGIEATRFANVGFYLGILGAVAQPAFFWYDAARTRAEQEAALGMAAARAAPRPVAA